MFHVKHRTDRFDAISEWLGVGIDETQRTALLRYELWLEEEAMPAGGIGPAEGDRLFDRHIADSMAFLPGIPQDARTVVDIGGGVGLPSIPLAIIQPDLEFALVDRSLRRTDLATRAIRILGLTNYSVLTEDAYALEPTYDVALFRASLPIGQAVEALRYCLRRSGTGLLAVSRQFEEPAIPSEPEGITFTLSREGDRALASPFWLLKMRFKE
jgi:16S rRNA G527 N7-methylase RsmG